MVEEGGHNQVFLVVKVAQEQGGKALGVICVASAAVRAASVPRARLSSRVWPLHALCAIIVFMGAY
jgi:hypothetical protein